jgi:acyl-CoA hydrolase
MQTPSTRFTDPEKVVDTIVDRFNGRIVVALPLGLGKANVIANALFQRAAKDNTISLTILSALTLETPRGRSTLQKRFIDPLRSRLFEGYPELDYPQALRHGRLPANIKVHEFFLLAGRWLGVPESQQNFILSNYTNAAQTLLDRGVNVVAQMVVRKQDQVSLSCNADVTPDLLKARRAGRAEFMLVGEVNPALPYMTGDAQLPESCFECLLEGPVCDYPLYAPPKLPVTTADYAAGFWIAGLIPDGGTLQIGIGSIGDAVARALIIRHQDNARFRGTIRRLSVLKPENAIPRHETPFAKGLFGLSEMLVDSFLPLMDAGVVKRAVDGALIQAAFFLGPTAFYKKLRQMPDHDRRRIQMKPVSWINSLYRDEERKREQRTGARFVNNAMMATLLGAVVSDSLEDGRVVSGVGGQYDFVAQAFALEDAHSIIALNATRLSQGRVRSNILWSYGNQTIPRHLRDIIVTEYGMADLRGKTDAETIAAMLNVTDSRFQNELLAQAKEAGKIDAFYTIPECFTSNTPETIAEALGPVRSDHFLPSFPFGTDFTQTEQQLLPALALMQDGVSSIGRLGLLFRGARIPHGAFSACLERLGLLHPGSLAERVYRLLVLGALDQTTRRKQSRYQD